MPLTFHEKRFLARGNRHHAECYGTVISPDARYAAWLQVDGTRESLLCRSLSDGTPSAVNSETYVLSPHFAGGLLLWSERIDDDWKLRAVDPGNPDPEAVVTPIETTGRPRALSSCRSEDCTWLVWEERSGKITQLRAATIRDARFGTPVEVTDGSFNAYDPACALAPDGVLHVVYSAFVEGNYRIFLQRLSPEGDLLGDPRPISNRPGPCIWPSVCPRTEGGVWFSFTHLAPSGGETTWIQHPRRRGQHGFFDMEQRSVDAGVWANGRLLAPLAAPSLGQGPVAAMMVRGSEGAGHTRILEGPDGRVRLLLRLQRDENESNPPAFSTENAPLRSARVEGVQAARNTHPDICLITLRDRQWSEPRTIVPRAHLEAPISLARREDRIDLAFAEDARKTGWSGGGEWFDAKGRLGVGIATVRLESQKDADYALRPFHLRESGAPSVREPRVDRTSGPYLHAMGQTHAHTNLSVCIRGGDGDGHLNYRMMQDVQGADFGATTDHAYNMWHTEMLHTRKLAEYYYFPGEFVAFPAYEWTGTGQVDHHGGPFGHVNPLWLEENGDLPFYTPADPDCPGCSLLKLWETSADRRILTPPHHVADHMHAYNWNFFDPEHTPVVEIFQDMRGSGERDRAPGVSNWRHREDGGRIVQQLLSGRRFGFIGGGDHSGISLAGVLVEELTRTGLYEAMKARRCFATTGLTMRLEFTCNDRIMGSSVPCDEAHFSLHAAAADTIREARIVRNGEDVDSVPAGVTELNHEWAAEKQEDGEFWYCRLIFANGEIAWTSPIWLD